RRTRRQDKGPSRTRRKGEVRRFGFALRPAGRRQWRRPSSTTACSSSGSSPYSISFSATCAAILDAKLRASGVGDAYREGGRPAGVAVGRVAESRRPHRSGGVAREAVAFLGLAEE